MPTFYGKKFDSALLLGTAQYPSPNVLIEAFHTSKAQIATVSLRREGGNGQAFYQLVQDLNLSVLPNTAGCHSVKEAVTTAHMAREFFDTKWIKLEVIGDHDTLQPNVLALVEAADILIQDGFEVFPYCTEDLSIAGKLLDIGCQVLMPWGSPIGSGRGLNNVYGLRSLRAHFPNTPLIIDAGIGVPSHAAQAMELGFDAVLLNTAVAKAGNPIQMAKAMSLAIEAGRLAYQSKPISVRDMAEPSTPLLGMAVLS